jgi:hypothetical protein
MPYPILYIIQAIIFGQWSVPNHLEEDLLGSNETKSYNTAIIRSSIQGLYLIQIVFL